ncbi:hypothetical protein A3849_10735 [Paenibacillus sp. P46E]|nr:hypothetical protein A3849_10735 [Paenibacillus sp. P46E]
MKRGRLLGIVIYLLNRETVSARCWLRNSKCRSAPFSVISIDCPSKRKITLRITKAHERSPWRIHVLLLCEEAESVINKIMACLKVNFKEYDDPEQTKWRDNTWKHKNIIIEHYKHR